MKVVEKKKDELKLGDKLRLLNLKNEFFDNDDSLSEGSFMKFLSEKGYNSVEEIDNSNGDYYLDCVEGRLEMMKDFLDKNIREVIRNDKDYKFDNEDLFVMIENVKNSLENLYFYKEVKKGNDEGYYGFNYFV